MSVKGVLHFVLEGARKRKNYAKSDFMNLDFLVIGSTPLMIPTKLKKKKCVTIFRKDNSVVNLGHCHDNTKLCSFFLFSCVCVYVWFVLLQIYYVHSP